MTALDKMPAEIHVLPAWREEGSSGPMHIVAPNFAGTQRYIRADLVPATPPDVAQAVKAALEAAADRLRIYGDMGGMEIVRAIDPATIITALAEGRGR